MTESLRAFWLRLRRTYYADHETAWDVYAGIAWLVAVILSALVALAVI